MLEESKDIKAGFRYSQARTLFEDDPRWKVHNHNQCISMHVSAPVFCLQPN